MEFNLMNSLELTVVAMVIVFLVLTGLMLLMQVTAKFAQMIEKKAVPEVSAPAVTVKENLAHDEELERVAVLVALAEAAQENANKHYEIEEIKRIK
ncbi:OadG family protein [Enterococcus pallens]|uniref:Uncharacterized protein n=1 Tax=Enterococcus pallens ATCC BAA-351 TaxID=1158607 RepID=R2S804_9ENTE|nr:OadG family protein [Enterococcus pallens]EOH91690.1 hypothetical protein UAU_02992 [Enterococcus pallens ATCC BAA-351]EOU25118.1 hypothetical protein I588_01106 [Enterococcus pallens ATCC BAA-351]OJG78484.1 hypothetical protein RV10_GL001479 [Enterococcus pallens]